MLQSGDSNTKDAMFLHVFLQCETKLSGIMFVYGKQVKFDNFPRFLLKMFARKS